MQYIRIGQKYYGYVTQQSPPEINGFFTEGLITCSGIVVTNPANGFLLMCHADGEMNLMHPRHGLPAWLRWANSPQRGGPITVAYHDYGEQCVFRRQIFRVAAIARTCNLDVRVEEHSANSSTLYYARENFAPTSNSVIDQIEEALLKTGAEIPVTVVNPYTVYQYTTDLIELYEHRHIEPIPIYAGNHLLTLEEVRYCSPHMARIFEEAPQHPHMAYMRRR